MQNVGCKVISGATAAAIKIAFDAWRNAFEPYGNTVRPTVISCTMFGVTDLIVFYFMSKSDVYKL